MKIGLVSLLLWFASPALAAPYSIDEQRACGGASAPERAKDNCADFESQPAFREIASIQDAKRACVTFYTKAWESNHLICSFANYVKEIKDADPSGELAKSDPTNRANFLARFRQKHAEIQRLAFEYQKQIGRMNTDGAHRSNLEMTCMFNANREKPGAVAGLLQMGLAQKVHLDFVINYPVIQNAVRDTATLLTKSNDGSLVQSKSIPLVDPKEGPSRMEGTLKVPEAPEDDTPQTTELFWAINSTAQYYAETYGDEFLAKWAKQLFRQYPHLAKKFPRLVKLIPEYAGSFAAGGLAVGMQYIVTGKVDSLDLLSIGVTAYSFGAGLAVDIGIAAYRDSKEKRREFAEFANQKLKKKMNMTSAELAWAWAEEKDKRCDVRDPVTGAKAPPKKSKEEKKREQAEKKSSQKEKDQAAESEEKDEEEEEDPESSSAK